MYQGNLWGHAGAAAPNGDHNLGGKDWDDRVAVYLARQFQEMHGSDPLADRTAFNDVLVRGFTT